jgi:hypothetical protein
MKKKIFLITIDVEDWFQVENFKPTIPYGTWGGRDLRVERNTHRLLDLFDESRGGRGEAKKSGSAEDRKLGSAEAWKKKPMAHRPSPINQFN